MTLAEIAADYEKSAALVRQRIGRLREMARSETDPAEIKNLKRRIQTLTVIWRETREMAAWAGTYYTAKPVNSGGKW